MKKQQHKYLKFFVIFLFTGIFGCATVPKGFLKPSETSLEKKQLQMRQYDTTDQIQILTAVSGVLQDLGFILDSSETKLGFVAASKKADATSGGQILLAALFGGARAVALCDASQVVKASVITKPSLDSKKTIVRVTFQRIVWNQSGQINRVESVEEPEIYQKFYDSLSKSIFLEAQKI